MMVEQPIMKVIPGCTSGSGMAAIRYTLVTKEHISIKVRDALGRTVAVLVDDVRSVGTYEVVWTADKNTPKGVYFCTLETESGIVTRSMVLLR